ncbi:50S ribosomal protein 5, chloroplastic-like [Punica granatum]|uniref:Uncharacterized protein n=2 Tax=Punica granatum TaxID=22663 RepID=A0A2I0HTA5_PUNGR|nr:50S ribosomal protein 5, chloroplastic-like [Punica granatum]PKI34934.1 hypothetical protein CRG98_044640 [Punica granatum]
MAVVVSPSFLQLRSTSLSSIPSSSPSSSSSSISIAASTVSKLNGRPIRFHSVSADGLSIDLPFVTPRRVLLTPLAKAAGTDEVILVDSVDSLSDSNEDEILAAGKGLLDAKLQRKLEQKMRMKLTKKARLRRKKLVRRRRMRKKKGQ